MRSLVAFCVCSAMPLVAAEQIPILTNGTGLLEGPALLGDIGGLRSGFAENGLLLDARLIADGSQHSHDGIYDAGRTYSRYLLEAGLTMDVSKFMGLGGAGRLTATWQTVDGKKASKEIGVLQSTSWLDNDGRDQLGRLFYVQPFFDEAFSIKFGKDEVIRDFATNPFGDDFLNDANRRQQSIFAMPKFPDSATMGLANLRIGDWYIKAGAYDGRSVTEGKETGKDWLSIPESDYFLIAETGLNWDDRRKGHIGGVKVGFWEHSGAFSTFDGGERSGVHGYYVHADYMVMDEFIDRVRQGIGIWGHFGEADDRVTVYRRQIALGGVWTGALPTRDRDALGASISWLETSRAAGATTDADERMAEFYYAFRATGWLTLQPDLQWFVHPGGKSNVSDIYVASLRGIVIF